MAFEHIAPITRLDGTDYIKHHRVSSSQSVFYPCVAICHLVRDSSLSITEKISSAIIPTTTITRLNRRNQNEVETGNFEESLELRVNDLEMRMTMFQTVLVKEKEKNIRSIKYLED